MEANGCDEEGSSTGSPKKLSQPIPTPVEYFKRTVTPLGALIAISKSPNQECSIFTRMPFKSLRSLSVWPGKNWLIFRVV